MKTFFLLLAFPIFFSPFVSAEQTMEIEDRWDQEGVLTVDGEDWSVRFERGEKGFSLRKRGHDAEQSMRIIPFDKNNDYAGVLEDWDLEAKSENPKKIRITFSTVLGNEIKGKFSFNDTDIFSLSPMDGMEGVRFEGEIKYGVLPGLFLEDIIYDPRKAEGASEMYIPPEELFAGLLGKGDGMFICTWPEGHQKAKILLEEKEEGPLIEGIELTLDNKNVYFDLLVERDIWHLAEFEEGYHGRDIGTDWHRPFEAIWRTEVLAGGRYIEGKLRSAWLIQEETRRWWHEAVIWVERGPVWFKNGEAVVHLTRQFDLAEGRFFIYPLEGHPRSLMGFLDRTPTAEHFSRIREQERDVFPTPRNVPNPGFRSCAGTPLIRDTLLKTGVRMRERKYLNEWIEYVIDTTYGTQNRRKEYADFLQQSLGKINTYKDNVEASSEEASFLRKMQDIAKEDIKSYDDYIRRGGLDSAEEYIEEAYRLGDRLREINRTPGTEFAPKISYIENRLNAFAWMHTECMGGWGWHLRDRFQKAGELSKYSPEAVGYAAEIRKDIRRHLKKRTHETLRHGL